MNEIPLQMFDLVTKVHQDSVQHHDYVYLRAGPNIHINTQI